MLKIKNLWVTIKGKTVVKGVSLVVRPGEVVALMGPNGSGKTSLALALAGRPEYRIVKIPRLPGFPQKTRRARDDTPALKSLAGVSSGVFLDGKDLLPLGVDERAKAGLFLAFQEPVAIPGLTVEKFLKRAYEEICCSRCREGGKLTEGCEKMSVFEFREMLLEKAESLQIREDLLERSVNEGFSGGERKRLEILQMEILRPKYVILDETDSGLDIDALKMVAGRVREWVRRKQGGVLLITHYQRFLNYIRPDRVLVMVRGKIVRRGGRELVRKVERKGYKGLVTSC